MVWVVPDQRGYGAYIHFFLPLWGTLTGLMRGAGIKTLLQTGAAGEIFPPVWFSRIVKTFLERRLIIFCSAFAVLMVILRPAEDSASD